MRMLGCAAAAAVLVMGAGSAQAAAFFDTVAQGQYRSYVFTLDGAPTSLLPEAYLSGHGLYSYGIDTPDGLFYDDFTDYPSAADCMGSSPCSKAAASAAGGAFLSVYTSGDSYVVTVENRMKDFDLCGTGVTTAWGICRAHQVPIELVVRLPGDNYRLTSTSGAIPEPATWAMMIAGFGFVGSTLRRRRQALA